MEMESHPDTWFRQGFILLHSFSSNISGKKLLSERQHYRVTLNAAKLLLILFMLHMKILPLLEIRLRDEMSNQSLDSLRFRDHSIENWRCIQYNLCSIRYTVYLPITNCHLKKGIQAVMNCFPNLKKCLINSHTYNAMKNTVDMQATR